MLAGLSPGPNPLLTPERWVRIIVLGAVFVAVFWDFFHRMTLMAIRDPDWSHALIVPVISLFFIYQNADRLKQMTARINWFGLVMLLIGYGIYIVGIVTPYKHIVVRGYGMIFALGGLVLFMTGAQMAKVLWFPVAYLVFAVRLPDQYWDQLAFKLQWIAAQCATVFIQILGIPLGIEADVSGQTIQLYKDSLPVETPLHVAGACSGLRMLMGFIALGVAVAYLAQRPWWHRLIMVGMTIPIAIFINVCRVTALGLIHPYNPNMSSGDFHTFVGMLMFIPGLGMFLLLGWVLDKLFTSHADPTTPSKADSATATEGDR